MTSSKTYRIFRFLLITSVCIIGITYGAIRFWLGYRFQDVVTDKDYPSLVKSLRASKVLPDKVYQAFDNVHSYNGTISTNSLIHKIPLELLLVSRSKRNRDNCPCFKINYHFVVSFWDRLTVGLQLDHDVGSQKCLDYYLNNFYFNIEPIGIRNAALYYFGKSLESMNETELIKLCLMTKSPSLYNPITHPENVERELKKLK